MNENSLPERKTLTVEEAAEALGIGRTLAYEAVRRGEIPTIRIGRRLLVPRGALDQLLGIVRAIGDHPPVASIVEQEAPQSELSRVTSTVPSRRGAA
jgi:excisionase family DNA binding protein